MYWQKWSKSEKVAFWTSSSTLSLMELLSELIITSVSSFGRSLLGQAYLVTVKEGAGDVRIFIFPKHSFARM